MFLFWYSVLCWTKNMCASIMCSRCIYILCNNDLFSGRFSPASSFFIISLLFLFCFIIINVLMNRFSSTHSYKHCHYKHLCCYTMLCEWLEERWMEKAIWRGHGDILERTLKGPPDGRVLIVRLISCIFLIVQGKQKILPS